MSSASGLRARPYNGDADRERLRAFITAAAADGRYADYFHPGDLVWRMYHTGTFDPFTSIRLWEDGFGGLLGFAWFYTHGAVDLQIHPDQRGRGMLEAAMLAWAVERHAELARQGESVGPLKTSAVESDVERIEILARHGFERLDNFFCSMRRPLDAPLPTAGLPAGFTIRHVAGDDDYEERVALHRDVWHPSKVTLPAYRRMRAIPGYRADLDLVAVAPDGAFASYCICWFDPVTGTGEFEPVGTRPAYRRLGLSRGVLVEGCRRLHALGARTALVSSVGWNEPANKLYESVGFRVLYREYDFVRQP